VLDTLLFFLEHNGDRILTKKKFKMFTWKSKVLFHTAATMIILLFMMIGNVSYSTAQQAFFWSPQEKIPEYYDATEEPPYLIADLNHTVHAFNSQPLDMGIDTSPKAIFYRQWTLDNGWTVPIDILYDERGGSIDLVGVVSDQFGVVHLIFLGSDQNLYYTHAYLGEAGSSVSWAEPQAIAGQARRPGPGFEYIGTIAVNIEVNKLVVIYSGSQYSNGLYYVFSSDHGASWSAPDLVYLVGGDDFVVTDPELFAGKSGVFHAVWSTFRSDGFGGSGYYASWDPANQSWSNSMELDVPGIMTPSVIEHNNDIFVSYHHVSSNGNWWRRSSDNGLTWTTPIRVSPRHVGTNGGISFVIDSNDTLHAFFGERINEDNHGIWHGVWIGTSWSNPEAVVRGPQLRDVSGGKGFDPRSARAVVSNGNVILVTWGTDGFAGVNGAWYSYKRLNTPELPAVPLVVPSAAIQGVFTENVPTMIPTSDVGSVPTIVLDNNEVSSQDPRSPQTIILLGVIPVILLLTAIILVRYYTSYFRSR
jgi:hypothetical protein